jgi:hypothetical protein
VSALPWWLLELALPLLLLLLLLLPLLQATSWESRP